MCDPITATAAAITVGSQVYQHQAEKKAARRTRQTVREEGRHASRDLSIRESEEGRATARDILGLQRDSSEVEGLLQTAAGAAGIQGSSLRLLLGDAQAETGRAKQANRDNLDMTKNQLARARHASRRGVAIQVASNPNPSALATGLRIGGPLLDAASIRESRKPTPGG